MKWIWIIFIFVNLAVCSYGQIDVGSACIVEHSKSSGMCTLLEECPSVVADISRNIYWHTRCVPFATNGTEIICCPDEMKAPPGKKSERKCEEYAAAVFEEVYSPASLGEPPTNLLVNKCTQKTVPLVPNSSVSRREYPHMALIGFNIGQGELGWLCGGTLISDEYVLIGGHCSNSEEYGQPQYVRFGELSSNSDSDYRPEEYRVSAVIPHPEYNSSSVYNDIALIKLVRKVELNAYKRPACLPTKEFDSVGSKGIFTGWGQDIQTGRALTHLRHLIVEILTTNICNATYASAVSPIEPETQICTGSKDILKDFNDSGGPLQIYHPNQYCMHVVIGVASFGSRLPSENFEIPDVHTRVFPYVEWIENIVWEDNPSAA